MLIENYFTWPEPGTAEREAHEVRAIWRQAARELAAAQLTQDADETCENCGRALNVAELFADKCRQCSAKLSHQHLDDPPF